MSGWVPEFEGQRPPFNGPPGNTLALQHGAYSPRRVDPLAQRFVDAVLADPQVTWLTAADQPALFALGRAEAKVQLFEDYLQGLAEEEGRELADLESKRVQAAHTHLHKAETRAATLRSQLGFTPLARARLGRDNAAASVDTARVMAELHRQEQARLAGQVEGEVAAS